ncbi:secreted RxLR effector protein 161-like [Lathyrus oleraceus]|uniref:secreted RxLR effector protein 161-like n=1 Tax=Pisum sativum TaxID=3888 RepID=UPI0021CE2F1E|nr:secreted RxLR effector protein 161-like [Pisum sativum]
MDKILKKYNYFERKHDCAPYDSSVKLFKNTSDSVRQTEYASIIGRLGYTIDCTMPYVVGLLRRFTSRSINENWQVIERVVRYLKKNMKLSLYYHRFPIILEGYNDVDWNTVSDDSKAISSYIFNIARGVVSWKSKKHTILGQFTMDSKMISLVTATEEASWLR